MLQELPSGTAVMTMSALISLSVLNASSSVVYPISLKHLLTSLWPGLVVGLSERRPAVVASVSTDPAGIPGMPRYEAYK
jgi:hypothetical protein